MADTVKVETVEDPTAGGGKRLATLVVVQGSDADLGAHARIERAVTIGRDPKAELTLTEAGASQRHAVVEPVEPLLGKRVGYVLRDLGSTNGTTVNGKRVKSTRKLKDGDKIGIASSTVLRFSLVDEVDAKYHAQVESMLATDDLTGLLARRRFEGALDEALRAATASEEPLGLLVLDIDGLKAVNDEHGHAMGAFTIVEVGKIVADVVKGQGAASRFGGDEFVAFLTAKGKAAATEVAGELRRRVEAQRMARGNVTVNVTVSIGVAAFPDDGMDAKELFELADRALYKAKARGKNRVA